MKRTTILILAIWIVTLLATGTFVYVYAAGTISSPTFEAGTQVETAAYTMWRESSTYYVKNGSTGEIASSSNASQLLIDAMDVLSGSGTEGGVIEFAITQAGGGAVFNFTTGFTVPTKVSLVGQSLGRAPRLSFIQTDGSDCITIRGSAGGAYSRIENLRVTGIQGTTGNGVVATTGVHTVTLKDVQSDNHGENGFLFNGSYNVKCYGIGASLNGEDGIHIVNATSTVGELYFFGAHSKDNTQDGFEIAQANCSNIVFIGGTFETNGRYGGWARGSPINLYGVKFEANIDDGLMWTAAGVISGCYLQSAPTNNYGLYFSTGTDTTVLGCRFATNWKDINIDSASHNLMFSSLLRVTGSLDIDIHASAENITFISVNPYGPFAYWNGTDIESLTLP